MIAYCWATGVIEFGEHLPEHAILVASGEAAQLRKVVSARARHGQGESQGCLLVPGVPEAVDQAAKGDALGHWLAWCAQVPKGLRWGGMAAAPARRDPLTRKTQVIAVVRDGGRIVAGARPGIRRLPDSLGEEVPAWQTALTAAQAQLLKEKN